MDLDLQNQLAIRQAAHSAEIEAHLNTATREKILNERLDELVAELKALSKTNAENQLSRNAADQRAKTAHEKRQAVEEMLEPLVDYLSAKLLDNRAFADNLDSLVADKMGDFANDRDFTNAVEEAVGNLSFEVVVR